MVTWEQATEGRIRPMPASNAAVDECPLEDWPKEAFDALTPAPSTPLVELPAEALAPIESSPGGFRLVKSSVIYEPLPPADYLVDGVIRSGSLLLLASYGGSGKTWLAIDLLVSVATGGKWLRRFDCRQGPCTLLDYESGEYEDRRRIQLVSRARKVEACELDIAPMPNVYMGDASFEHRVGELAKVRTLIVLDSLAAASPGAKENEASMRVGLDQLRRISEATGCTFVVIVHAKKTSGSKAEIDPREILRGSSAIYDAADAVLVVAYTKGKPLRLMQCKARHGVEIDSIDVELVNRDGGVAIVASAPQGRAASPNGGAWSELKTRLLDAAKRLGGMSKNALAIEVKGTRSDKLKAIDELVAEGRIALLGGVYRFANHREPPAGGA